MARDRNLPSDIWTREALIYCTPMARLLFLGLWNFADDFGVQPLLSRTIRLQVFPGDALDDGQVRVMIDELVAYKLLRVYEVDGQEYVAIAHWAAFQRIGRRARRMHPRDPALPPEPAAEPALTPPPAPAPRPAPAASPAEMSRWRRAISRAFSQFMQNGAPDDADEWIRRLIADGCDLHRDVIPAISAALRPFPDREESPGLAAVAAYAHANRVRRLTVESVSATRGLESSALSAA